MLVALLILQLNAASSVAKTLTECTCASYDMWLQLRHTPEYGAGSNTQGLIEGATNDFGDTRELSVAIYSITNIWWPQPTWAQPFTAVDDDFKWQVDIHLGYNYAALLVNHSTFSVSAANNVYGNVTERLEQLLSRDDVWAAEWQPPDFHMPTTTKISAASSLLPDTTVTADDMWLQIRHTPEYGAGSYTQGSIEGITNDFGDVRRLSVAIYSITNKWWSQPTWAQPFTAVDEDFKWQAVIHLGYEYVALLVNHSTFDVSIANDMYGTVPKRLEQLLLREDVWAADWQLPDYQSPTTSRLSAASSSMPPVTSLPPDSSLQPDTSLPPDSSLLPDTSAAGRQPPG